MDDHPVTELEAPPRLPFPVVGLGGSAGALTAFFEFFEAMADSSGMAYVVVQHLPPARENLMAELLSTRTRMPVHEVEDGMAVERDHVYIIRPGRTLTLRDGVLHLSEPTAKPLHRRPVDDFFRSLAEEQRERAICVIMSGMGSNGTEGARRVKAVGGLCIAQEPGSAKYPSMPHCLIDAGLADFVLPPREMPARLGRYSSHPYVQEARRAADELSRERPVFDEILTLLLKLTRHDFSAYKTSTLLRRMQRRMGLNQLTALAGYVRLLRENPGEVANLAEDLLIHVTNFFRDPEAWEQLREKVIRPLVDRSAEGAPVRAWVTACSSGEEAYSMAILLVEEAERAGKDLDIKIFATDTAERSLALARRGVFPGGIESDVTPERLRRFFDRDEANYRVKKDLRERVVFAPQNVLQDSPFSQLDVCSCRNLLTYIEPEFQRRALALLHFALREGGVLFLGSSETVATQDDLFETIDKKHRIFRRTGPARHGAIDFPLAHTLPAAHATAAIREGATPQAVLAQLTNKTLLERFGPPSVVIDRQRRIVHFHGNTTRFLNQPPGEPSRELLTLVHESVRSAVRAALHQATSQGTSATVDDGFVEDANGRRRVEVTVTPLVPGAKAAYFLVIFHERPEPPLLRPATKGRKREDRRLLEAELQRTRDELQSTIEELQLSNEELRASGEESTSINEELQSSNEELETSKEELQSLNEELITANSQLRTKMEELEGATNDLASLLSSTDIAVIFLDEKFHIRRFTPAIKDLMDLIPADIGRPLRDLARKFDDPEILRDAEEVLAKHQPVTREVTSHTGRGYMRRALPYRTGDPRVRGVVLTFVDITERRQMERTLRDNEERYRLILEGTKEYAIFMLDREGRVQTWTPVAERLLGYSAKEAVGQSLFLIDTPEDRTAQRSVRLIQRATETGAVAEERWVARGDGSRFWASSLLSALHGKDGALYGFVKILRDNTERKRTEEALLEAKREAEAANQAKDQFLANVSHELRTPLSAILLWTVLFEELETIDPTQLREGLDVIKRSAEEQRELIEDLVDTARIVSGKLRLDLKETDLATVVHSAVEAIRPAAQMKQIEVRENLDAAAGRVAADRHRLYQVLSNLLSNAVKFTPEEGSITVNLIRRDANVVISVEDTGRGLSPEFLPDVFDRFRQAEPSTTRTTGGLGLGLTIAKEIVELHGGTISVHSDGTNKGSTFTVELPLPALKTKDPTSGNGGSFRRISAALDRLHLLVIEDREMTRNALAAVLRQAGAQVTDVDSAPAAIEQYQRRRPDVIISDIGLPQIDGCELIERIRALEKSRGQPPVPALALTAFATENNYRRALKSGFQRCLTKPVDPLVVVDTLIALIA